ncbi:MAG: polyprenol monophosphomannose synthase [Actinomycetota bacterium]|nr:polyprenol monophosphomannose synthase [Actinomycetota bacterium]
MRALVVVPTYNESATLERVVARSLQAAASDRMPAAGSLEMLIVDDASPDGTGDLAARLSAAHTGVHVLHRPGKQGLGSAYRTGFGWGMERGFDVLCEMDADLSHDPADLPRLLRTLAGADLVIGSRYVPTGGVVDWPLHRRALSKGGNRYVQLATGMPVADATAGFRAYRRTVLEALDLTTIGSEGYAFQIEMALRSWRLGFRVMEVPITFVERSEGASKISRAIVAEALWRVLVWGLTGPRRPADVHPDSIAAETEVGPVVLPPADAGPG